MNKWMMMSVAGLLTLPTLATADQVMITIENTQAAGEFFFTPFWVGLHDGSFDTYDGGTMASMWPGLTPLAEGGDTGPLSTAFGLSSAGIAGGVDATVLAINGAGDAPVFSPGESASMVLNSGDATVNRYFSYASMVIPSNDLFVANGNPMAHEIFDAGGNFTGDFTIQIFGNQVNDNGTEVNDAFGGAAFSANGGADADEMELIRSFFTDAGDEAYLNSFVGTDTVTGDTITSAFRSDDLIATITISHMVPTPGALSLLGVAGLLGRRRIRKA